MRGKYLVWIMILLLLPLANALVVNTPSTGTNLSRSINVYFTNYNLNLNHRIILSNGLVLNTSTWNNSLSYNTNSFQASTASFELFLNLSIGSSFNQSIFSCIDSHTGYLRLNYYYSDGSNQTVDSIHDAFGCSYTINTNPNLYRNVSYIEVYARNDGTGYYLKCGTTYGCYNTQLYSLININNISMDISNYNLSTGLYSLNVTSFNDSANVSTNISGVFNITANALLNVSVYSYLGSPINFTANTSSTQYFGFGSLLLEVTNGSSYILTINSSNYASNVSTVTISNFGTTYINRTLNPYNSLNIYVRNESSGELILSSPNTSIDIVSDSGVYNSSTVNGSTSMSGFPTDYYTFTFSKAPFTDRQYYLNVFEGSNQVLTAYLNNGSAILFNIMNNGGSILSGATLFVYTSVNGSNVLVESAVSDITGKIQVSLESSKYYSFLVSKSGYTNYTFFLNPVLFTSYDIKLSTSSSASIYPTATFSYTPTSFFRFQNVNMALTFISPYNYLSTYYYNISYPGGSRAGSGSNIHGQVFNELFNLNSAGLDDNIVLYYNYSLTNGAFYSDTIIIPIIYTSSNRTWVGMGNQINSSTGQDGVTGYYIGERVLIVTFISIVMFGVGWLIGGAMSGLVFAIIPILFFTNVGFVPKELYYLTFVFFIVYIISRGADS